MKLFLELGAKPAGLIRGISRAKRSVAGFTRGARKELAALKSSFGSVHGQLAAMGLSIGAGKVIADSAQLTKSLTRIKQTASGTDDQIKTLRQDLFGMGRESGKSIEGLKEGFDSLVQGGLNMDESTASLKAVNIAMAVTDASARSLTDALKVGSSAFDFDLAKPGQAMDMLDKMTVAGRLGNAELQDLSSVFSRVGQNAKAAKMGFSDTLAFVETLSKVEQNPDRLATLADSAIRVFTNLNYMKEAQKASKVMFFNDDESRRNARAVLMDIKKKYSTLTTDAKRAQFIFGAFGKADQETRKGLETLLNGDAMYQMEGIFKAIDEAGGTLKDNFDEATSNLPDQINMLKNDLRSAADSFVQPLDRGLTNAIKKLRASKADGGFGMDGKDMMLWGTALLGGGVVAGRLLPKAMRGIAGKFFKSGGSTAAGIAAGKAVEKMTGVAPVFVTNWPAGGLGGGIPGGGLMDDVAGGMAGGAAGKGWLKSILGKGKALLGGSVRSAPVAATAAGVIGSGLAGWWIGDKINWLINKQVEKASSGRWSGPGALGEKIYDLSRELPGEIKNAINLAINFDWSGRMMTVSDDPNTTVTSDTNRRGKFGAGAVQDVD
jgi:TP901 family phage tail tape measure protein